MKAAVIVKANDLHVLDVPIPETGDYQVLCELLYGATCSGTDTHLINCRFPWPPVYPAVLGHESIGRAIKVGAKVRNFKVGDVITRVGTLPSPGVDICWGGFAEYGIAVDHIAASEDGRPAGEWQGYRWNKIVPEDIDAATATMIITWRETYSFLTRMGFKADMSLLVVGSGGNGLAFAAHGANLGASRVGLIGHIEREKEGTAVGVTEYFDYKDASLAEKINAANPDGYDVIIDVIGKHNTLNDALPYLKSDGMLSIYGIDEFGSPLLSPSKARGSFTFLNRGYDESETHEEIVAFIRQGKLDAANWLNMDTPYPLANIADAFKAVGERKHVKALIKLKI
jgi:D-arabinose 1-dehydrogenase-like Zn-dependent alcohol dehydrogenase